MVKLRVVRAEVHPDQGGDILAVSVFPEGRRPCVWTGNVKLRALQKMRRGGQVSKNMPSTNACMKELIT